jgi:myo-inositol-1-phosphate synthase
MGVMDGAEFSLPFKDLLPLAQPCEMEIGGWDISGLDLYQATRRARVLEPDLIGQLKQPLEAIRPLRAVFYKDFIASNQ